MSPASRSASQGEKVSLAPHPSALIESLRSIGYTLDTALADIVDNSITAEAHQISVQFRWNGGDPWVAITDDGYGMSPGKLTEAMRFGSSSPLDPRDAKDLGRFGLGMKTASISQCRRLIVVSRKDGQLSACEWDLDAISRQVGDEWLLGMINEEKVYKDDLLKRLVENSLGNCNSGTIVLWRNLDPSLSGEEAGTDETRFNDLLDSARGHLETIFHRFLSPDLGQKGIKIDFNGSELEAFNPFGPAIPARQELPSEEIRLAGGTVLVQPFVLPHHSKVSRQTYSLYAGEAGYLQNQGFYIYRNRRLIVKATWFKLIKNEELNKLIRIRVDIPNTLDHLWQINVNKSQVRPPEQVRRQLKKVIRRIEGAGKMVYKRRAVRLGDRNMTPVWKREVVDSKIRYSINEKHPLLAHILNSVPEPYPKQLKTFLELIADGFPYDSCFADVASDDVELDRDWVNEEEVRHACLQLVAALRAFGFEDDEIRRRALRTEIPGASEELINSILEEEQYHA